MYTYTEVKNIIEKEIEKLHLPAHPAGLYEPAGYLLAIGGKRFRPSISLLCANIFTDNIDECIKPALAMEVFHNFTLMHDDILDKAVLRRGNATVHEKWDLNTAILSGDVMLVKAYELLVYDKQNIVALIQMFNRTAVEVCEGQRLDMDFEKRNDVSTAEYINMITLKTAVLLGCCAYTGAITGGADESQAGYLYEFGKNMGIGFQMHDDILDVYGDTEKVGKMQGGDIAQNKKTFLWCMLMEKTGPAEKKYFYDTVIHFPSEEKIKYVTALYDKYAIKAMAEDILRQHFTAAITALDHVDVPAAKKEILLALAAEIAGRNF